jgi:hypothetical protein
VTSATQPVRLKPTMRTALALALSSVLLACGREGDATSFGGMTQPSVSTAPAGSDESTAGSSSSGSAADSSSSTSSTSSTSTGSTSDGVKWDMGMPDFDPPQPAGCEGKIDFLFVISAEGTMKDDQEGLIASFPGFMDAIQEQLASFDVHLLVANPNPKPGWIMDDCGLCMDDCDPQAQPPLCGAALTACDKKIGAGVTYPAGSNASNQRCELAGDLRYITSGQQDIDQAFACVAQVGSGGAGRTGEAMVAALQPEFNDPDDEYACNGGFLRTDALLVVTIIQDTYEEDSLGTVDDWIAALRAAKTGDDDAFMVLVLTTDVDLGYMQHCLPNEYNPNPNRLRTLANDVEHGFVGSICMPEGYGDWFKERVTYLVDLCDDFVPPG